MGAGSAIAWFFCTARDWIARGLVRIGVSPNALTIAGTFFTLLAGVCLALGSDTRLAWTFAVGDLRAYQPNAYTMLAGVCLYMCSAGDMLDGAVARIGGKSTKFGAFLDSTLDRFSDFFIYVGIAFYFVLRGNVTYAVL
jgi:CDP-diacylglycerol--glycerol-3-phosphate 3-phosphatidyltransferase